MTIWFSANNTSSKTKKNQYYNFPLFIALFQKSNLFKYNFMRLLRLLRSLAKKYRIFINDAIIYLPEWVKISLYQVHK